MLFLFIFICTNINTNNKAVNSFKFNYLVKINKPLNISKGLNILMNRMSFIESSYNIDTINNSNHYGKYQFGKTTLFSLGISNEVIDSIFTKKLTLSESKQDELFIKLLRRNESILKDYIDFNNNKYFILNNGDSILITKSGILAAAHLGGPGSVVNLFRDSINKSDSNGTTLLCYMKKFSDISL